MINNAINIYVRDFRKKHGLKQAEMAVLLDISQCELSYIETGKRKISKEVTEKLIKHGVLPDNLDDVGGMISAKIALLSLNDRLLVIQLLDSLIRN